MIGNFIMFFSIGAMLVGAAIYGDHHSSQEKTLTNSIDSSIGPIGRSGVGYQNDYQTAPSFEDHPPQKKIPVSISITRIVVVNFSDTINGKVRSIEKRILMRRGDFAWVYFRQIDGSLDSMKLQTEK